MIHLREWMIQTESKKITLEWFSMGDILWTLPQASNIATDTAGAWVSFYLACMTKNHDETSSESWHIVTDSPGKPRILMQCLSEDCKAEVRGWFWISYLSYNDIMPSESDQDCHLISRYEWLIPVVAGRRVLLPHSVGECKSSEALMSRSRPIDSGPLTLFMLA